MARRLLPAMLPYQRRATALRKKDDPSRSVLFAAWTLAATSLTLVAIGAVLQIVTRAEDVGRYFFGSRGFTAIAVLAFALLGLLLTLRIRENPIGWLFLIAGLLGGIQNAATEYAVWELFAHSSPSPGALKAAWLNEWIWVPLAYAVGAYAVMLFPDGRLPSPRWRPLLWLASAGLALATFAFMTTPGPMRSGLGFENPFGLEPGSTFSVLQTMGTIFVAVPVLGAAAAPIFRARRAGPVERTQIRWLGFSAAVLAVVFPTVGTFILTFGDTGGFVVSFFENLMVLALIAVPVSIAIAILKYRLYDIDVVINRTLVYGALTAILTGAYFGFVVLLQRAVPGADDSELAVAASTLAVAALFRPARTRLQAFIDRRFYRSKYDAQRTLEDFTGRLRDEMELSSLSGDVLDVVRSSVQPNHVSLWLKPEVSR